MISPHVDSIKYLSQLSSDLKLFTPDQVQMVRGYLPKTHLKSRLVEVVSNLRIDLISNPDKELTNKFKQLKQNLLSHIDKRIVRLQNPDGQAKIDPWIALEQQTTSADLKQQCLDASTHIEDVLFACAEVINKDLGEACLLEAQDVGELRSNFLPKYLKMIPQTTETQNSIKSTLEGFRKLESSLLKADFVSAKKSAQQINALLIALARAI